MALATEIAVIRAVSIALGSVLVQIAFVLPSGWPRSLAVAIGALGIALPVLSRSGLTRSVLSMALVSQLALGADPVDAGTDLAIAVSSATLHPLDAPTESVDFGRGVCMPEALSVTVAGKAAAYEAAEKAAASPQPINGAFWVVAGLVVLALGGGFTAGWLASNAARPTAAQ